MAEAKKNKKIYIYFFFLNPGVGVGVLHAGVNPQTHTHQHVFNDCRVGTLCSAVAARSDQDLHILCLGRWVSMCVCVGGRGEWFTDTWHSSAGVCDIYVCIQLASCSHLHTHAQ